MEVSDAERFDRLFLAHRNQLFAFFLGHTNCRDEAKDLLQETFVRAWKHIGHLPRDEDRQRFWLFRTAKNLLTDHYRKPKPPSESEPPTLSIEGVVEARMELEYLQKAIGRLPDERRAILTMSVVGGMSSDEIGTVLARPSGTIRYELSQARKALMKEIQNL